MIALDTNVLIRILVDDEAQAAQLRLARDFAKKHSHLFIPQIVQVETAWVLGSAYGLEKSEIIRVLEHLRNNTAFVLQNAEIYEEGLSAYRKGGADFSDYLIEAESRAKKSQLVTFDKKLARLGGVTLLG